MSDFLDIPRRPQAAYAPTVISQTGTEWMLPWLRVVLLIRIMLETPWEDGVWESNYRW